MARPRSFNETEALEAAIDCFWRNGLQSTSVRELAAQMGINGPSLYNAFGDKRALFAAALEHYVETRMRQRLQQLEATAPPGMAIREFFHGLIERSLDDDERRGCMVVNTAFAAGSGDDELDAAVAGYLSELEGFFRRDLERAIASGAADAALDPARHARHLLGVMLGVRTAARVRPERELLEGIVEPALSAIRPTDQPRTRSHT